MTMTQTGMLVGTPDYMSPEQVMGEQVDARSDLFTFGVILYELLTGATPYKADSVQGTMFKRTRERAKPPIEVNPEIPRILSDIASKCLEIDPQTRYQSAREILQDFEAWRGGAKPAQTIAFRRPPGIALSWKTISAIVAGLVLIAAGILIVMRSSSGAPGLERPPSRSPSFHFTMRPAMHRSIGSAPRSPKFSAPTSANPPACAWFLPNASARCFTI